VLARTRGGQSGRISRVSGGLLVLSFVGYTVYLLLTTVGAQVAA